MSILTSLRDTYKSLVPKFGRAAFHGDRIYQSLIKAVIESIRIDCFVETGTYLGNSSGFVASNYPRLSIYTCELNEAFLQRARYRLKRFDNIRFHLNSSEQFIADFIQRQGDCSIPLFFLDSHWHKYWPLEDEVRSIAESGIKSVVVIDDFQVPGSPQFGFDVDVSSGNKICGTEMILPALTAGNGNSYNYLMPQYRRKDAFSAEKSGPLRGHIVIFQNLSSVFERFSCIREVKSYYQQYLPQAE